MDEQAKPGTGTSTATNEIVGGTALRETPPAKTPPISQLGDGSKNERPMDRTEKQPESAHEEPVQARETYYSLTAKGRETVEFKPPQGRRGGGPLHVRMMKVLYYFYLKKGWYARVDQGDEPQSEPDLLVWELIYQVRKLEDGRVERRVDPAKWKMPPFHVEAETTPRKSKSQVIMNYEKAWSLKRYVVFAVPSKQDADDLRKIMEEISAPSGSYEIDDISDLLAEDLKLPEPMGPMEVAP
ncbi:MAG: hypothetical protein ACRD6W_07700 [Nitrososphaerales archaeon]